MSTFFIPHQSPDAETPGHIHRPAPYQAQEWGELLLAAVFFLPFPAAAEKCGRNYRETAPPYPGYQFPHLLPQESGARKLEGHDIMALERFDPEVAHMIVFDVLSRESHIGDKGDRMRLFLTEAGYKKALEDQGRSFIQILNHAKVSQGHLRYDRLDGER